MPPVLQQPRVSGVTCQSAGFGQLTPLVHMMAKLVDYRSRVVLLFLGRKLVENQRGLLPALLLLRLGNRSDELCTAASLDNLLRGLPVGIEFPMRVG